MVVMVVEKMVEEVEEVGGEWIICGWRGDGDGDRSLGLGRKEKVYLTHLVHVTGT